MATSGKKVMQAQGLDNICMHGHDCGRECFKDSTHAVHVNCILFSKR
jgi:hypothetical protein